MIRPLKIVAWGDVHMCHSTTFSEKIFEEIKHCFPYNKWASSIDIMMLDGDFWDKLMPNNHPDVYITKEAIIYILEWVKKHDITLLIVDGTPLHDANQIQWFLHLNETTGINADIVFADDISIRYVSKFDIHVLFIPDRPRSKPEDAFKRVQELLKEEQLEKVDLALMHGSFQYQIPEIAPEHKHNESDYFSVVKGPIIIGHIHTHSTNKQIIAPGSFSRLKHGEEEAKGFVEILVQPSGDFRAKFIENTEATIYKTVIVTGLDLETSLEKIKRNIENLPNGSRIRIVCEKNHPLASDKTFMSLKTSYVQFMFSLNVKVDKTVIAEDKDVFSTENEYVPLIINNKNIEELIVNKLNQLNTEATVVKQLPRYLSQII